jgi:tight adherence protein C
MAMPLVLGVIVGLGSILSWRLLFPPAPPLQTSINRLYRRNKLVGVVTSEQNTDTSDLFGRTIGASLERVMRDLGMRLDPLEANLRLVGRNLEQHLAQKVVLGLFGLLLPLLMNTVLVVIGMGFAFVFPVILGILLGLLFFFAPDIGLKSEATDRRKDFRHALSSYLDLVVISLAGGAGVENALRDAAAIGRGWAFARLRDTLQNTELTGESPWVALAQLGEYLDIRELIELSASLSLAGTEGARVRESLAVKAASLREHALAAAEAEAESTTETMAVPVVLLFAGFLVLIGYPALDAVLAGL